MLRLNLIEQMYLFDDVFCISNRATSCHVAIECLLKVQIHRQIINLAQETQANAKIRYLFDVLFWGGRLLLCLCSHIEY